MELTSLRYFVEVATTGNITRASENLHIAQSALSRQIKMLESELGQPLFTRSLHRVYLTETGNVFLKKAKEILALSQAAVAECSIKDTSISGPLSLAFVDDSFTDTLPSVIDGFKQAYPLVQIDFFNGGHKYIQNLLDKNIADIVCTYRPSAPQSDIFIKTNSTRRFGILMKENDILSDRETIDKEIYSQIPLIIPQGAIYEDISMDDIIPGLSKLNLVARSENPLLLFELLKRDWAYILCLEPSPALLLGTGIIFRPIYPMATEVLYFLEGSHPKHEKTAKAFMTYVKQIYGCEP